MAQNQDLKKRLSLTSLRFLLVVTVVALASWPGRAQLMGELC